MKRWLAMLAIAACGFGYAPAAMAEGAPGISPEEIKIGVHMPLTGPASFVGQGSKVGIDLAVAEINANGGINGRKFAVSVVDDRGTPDGGVAAVRRLVDSEQVFAVLGAGTSTATVSVVPYFIRQKVPYYVSLASDPRVLENFAPNIYSGATVPQAALAKAYATFLLNTLMVKNVALLQCDQAHCTSGGPRLKGLLEEKGAAVQVYNFNSGDTDFTGQLYSAAQQKPDVVFIYGLANDGGRIVPQIRRAAIEAPIVADTSLADPAVIKASGSAGVGMYTFWLGGTQFITDQEGGMGQFHASLKAHAIETPASTPNLYSLMTYADTYVLAEGLRQAGDEPTREALLTSLDSLTDFVAGKDAAWSFAAPIGLPRTFTTTDHQGTRGVQPVVVKDGKFVPAT